MVTQYTIAAAHQSPGHKPHRKRGGGKGQRRQGLGRGRAAAGAGKRVRLADAGQAQAFAEAVLQHLAQGGVGGGAQGGITLHQRRGGSARFFQ